MGLRGLSNSQGLLSLTRCLLALSVCKLGPRSGLIEVLQALLEIEQLSIGGFRRAKESPTEHVILLLIMVLGSHVVDAPKVLIETETVGSHAH